MTVQHNHTTDSTLAGANDVQTTLRGGEGTSERTMNRALFSAMALGVLYGSVITSALIFLVQGVAK